MARATHDNMTAISGDATSFLSDTVSASIRVDNATVDGTVIGDTSDKQCIVKKSATLELDLQSSNANCSVTGLDMTAFTIASIDFLGFLQSLNFSMSNQFKEIDGVSDEWMARQFVKQVVSTTASVLIATDAATEDGVIIGAFSSTLSNANAVLAFTINSVAFSVPLVVTSAVHKTGAGDLQMWDFTFAQRGAITSPSGTGSLLTKAINAPGTAQAWIVESNDPGGITYAGDFLPEQISFNVTKQDRIITSYRYVSTGEVTATATVA